MENIFTNSGMIHIREQIFGYFDHKTLKNCREVFAKKFGEDWDLWLERLILVKCLLESDFYEDFNDMVPGWDKAVKKFDKMASLNDLNEVKGSLEDFNYSDYCGILLYAAEEGHVKLMELLLYTDLDINEEDDYYGTTPFIEACKSGQTEIVDLMITGSKKYGIDLNAAEYECYEYDRNLTGLMYACQGGKTEIVNLMITASKEYDIDLNEREEGTGFTAFIIACREGNTEIVKLMIENRTKYEINIQEEDDDGDNALDNVNQIIEEVSEKEEATFKELKHILEKAYLEANGATTDDLPPDVL